LAYLASPFAQLHCKIHRRKPLFTAYSIFTLKSNSNFSSEKAKKILGYTITPFTKTLEDTLGWISENKLFVTGKKAKRKTPRHHHVKLKSLNNDVSPSNGTTK